MLQQQQQQQQQQQRQKEKEEEEGEGGKQQQQIQHKLRYYKYHVLENDFIIFDIGCGGIDHNLRDSPITTSETEQETEQVEQQPEGQDINNNDKYMTDSVYYNNKQQQQQLNDLLYDIQMYTKQLCDRKNGIGGDADGVIVAMPTPLPTTKANKDINKDILCLMR